jgi:hypothetical protein
VVSGDPQIARWLELKMRLRVYSLLVWDFHRTGVETFSFPALLDRVTGLFDIRRFGGKYRVNGLLHPRRVKRYVYSKFRQLLTPVFNVTIQKKTSTLWVISQ